MAIITLKNIPADLHRDLKKRAEQHHRSLNKEIIATKCSAYDCEFVALAHTDGVRLLTVDREILHDFPEVDISLKDSCETEVRSRTPDASTGNLYVIAGDTPAATVSALWLTKMLLRPPAKKLPEPTD